MYMIANSPLPPNSQTAPSESERLRRNRALQRTDEAIRRAREAHDCVRDLVLRQPKPYAQSVQPQTLYSGQAQRTQVLYGGPVSRPAPSTAMLYSNLPTDSTGGLVDLSSGIVSTRSEERKAVRTNAANHLFEHLTPEQRDEIANAPEILQSYSTPHCIEPPKPPPPPRYDHPTWGNATAEFPETATGVKRFAQDHPLLALALVVGGAFALGSAMEG